MYSLVGTDKKNIDIKDTQAKAGKIRLYATFKSVRLLEIRFSHDLLYSLELKSKES